MSLTLFPTPFPDEALASLFCRYHLMIGNHKPHDTYRQLAGQKYTWSDRVRSCSIADIAERIGPSLRMSTTEIVDTLTLFPLHLWLVTNTENSPSTNIGIGQVIDMTMPFRPVPLRARARPRFCPSCVQADQEVFGIAYWHLSHQPRHSTVCPIHSRRLMNSCPWCGQHFSVYEKFMLPVDQCRRCGRRASESVFMEDQTTWFEVFAAQFSFSLLKLRRRPDSRWSFRNAETRITNNDPTTSIYELPAFARFLDDLHAAYSRLDVLDDETGDYDYDNRWTPFQSLRVHFLTDHFSNLKWRRAHGSLHALLVMAFAFSRGMPLNELVDDFVCV